MVRTGVRIRFDIHFTLPLALCFVVQSRGLPKAIVVWSGKLMILSHLQWTLMSSRITHKGPTATRDFPHKGSDILRWSHNLSLESAQLRPKIHVVIFLIHCFYIFYILGQMYTIDVSLYHVYRVFCMLSLYVIYVGQYLLLLLLFIGCKPSQTNVILFYLNKRAFGTM